jgi:hypothetical protein
MDKKCECVGVLAAFCILLVRQIAPYALYENRIIILFYCVMLCATAGIEKRAKNVYPLGDSEKNE